MPGGEGAPHIAPCSTVRSNGIDPCTDATLRCNSNSATAVPDMPYAYLRWTGPGSVTRWYPS
jgi:hypothetical protein